MLQLILHNHNRAITVNNDIAVTDLKKYLETIVHIPVEQQQIGILGRTLLNSTHDDMKCVDAGLVDNSSIVVTGPTFAHQKMFGITKVSIQFNEKDTPPISLSPRFLLVWAEKECLSHRDNQCYTCDGTGNIMKPCYYPLTPLVNLGSEDIDFLTSLDIQGSADIEYNTAHRLRNYPSGEIKCEDSDEKITRILLADFSERNTSLNHVVTDDGVSAYRFVLTSPERARCKKCYRNIFHNGTDTVAWCWHCDTCHCMMHTKCALDSFQENGVLECMCPMCSMGDFDINRLRNRLNNLIGTLDQLL